MRGEKGVKLQGREEDASIMYPFGAGTALPASAGHIARSYSTAEDKTKI